jgi:hypothetical protein
MVLCRALISLGFGQINLFNKEGGHIVKNVISLLCAVVLALSLSTAVFVREASAQESPAKQDKWEGTVTRSSPDKSTLTVRKVGSNDERTVQYDSSTRWVSQYHGSKKVNDIDASKVGDHDRVICKGTWDKDGVLHATLISKRLSH